MVSLRCFTDTKLLWQYAKIFVTIATGVGCGPGLMIRYIARRLKPHFGTVIWHLSPIYKPNYSQFHAQIA